MPTRLYFVIHAATASVPSETAWRNVLSDAVQQTGTLARAIQQAALAAEQLISASKRSQGTGQVRRYTLGGFQLRDNLVDDAIALLNSIAATRGITGSLRAKFEGVINAELQEAAIRQGFSAQQAALITTAIVGYGTPQEAMDEAQAYMVANSAIWYGAA